MGSFSKQEKERLKSIISDTVTLLCKNGLTAKFKREFTVEGLIGITLDSDDLLLVSIKESVENPDAPPLPSSHQSDGGSGAELNTSLTDSARKRKRKRKKHPSEDGASPTKTIRTNDDSDDNNLDTPTKHTSQSEHSTQHNDSNMDNSNLESNDSFFTLQDIKQDHSDDDLIQIIKEEPGPRSTGSGIRYTGSSQFPGPPPLSIVSMQQFGGHDTGQGMYSDGSAGVMGVGHQPSGTSGIHIAPTASPTQYDDIMQQVELITGSGVYIKKATYNQLQFIDKGSKLVRKLVREIFPDVHLLASSSCMGKGETSAGLDRHKVDVIKEYARVRFDLKDQDVQTCINNVCSEIRKLLKKKHQRNISLIMDSDWSGNINTSAAPEDL